MLGTREYTLCSPFSSNAHTSSWLKAPRRFYMIPKIHEPPSEWTIPNKMTKDRPIISDCNSV